MHRIRYGIAPATAALQDVHDAADGAAIVHPLDRGNPARYGTIHRYIPQKPTRFDGRPQLDLECILEGVLAAQSGVKAARGK